MSADELGRGKRQLIGKREAEGLRSLDTVGQGRSGRNSSNDSLRITEGDQSEFARDRNWTAEARTALEAFVAFLADFIRVEMAASALGQLDGFIEIG